jgi:hypothetical protein
MRSRHKAVLTAAAVFAMISLPALAAPGGVKGPNPNAPGQSKGAPGPIAGAGLPFLLLAGGYAVMRHYGNRAKAE